ncbi:MAG: nucleotide exchange factor GrpE [Myxococcota bacterium]
MNGMEEVFKEAEASVEKIASKKESGGGIAVVEVEEEKRPSEEEKESAVELKEKLLRALADFQNYRQRVAKEKGALVEATKREVLHEFLPVVDNFERAFAAQGDAEHILSGLQMVYKQFTSALKNFGLVEFTDEGKPFDPMRHEAVEQVETEEYEAGTIVRTAMKGYLMGEKLLRAARVVVAKQPEKREESSRKEEVEKNEE